MLRRLSLVLFAIATACLCAAPADRPAFEVASLKPSGVNLETAPYALVGMLGGPGTPDPGRFNAENVTLRMLVMRAYGLKKFQVTGPAWIDSERYNVTAKVPAGATAQDANLMLQSLLEERFKLGLRRESQEQPVYALTIGRKGPKMKESQDDEPPAASGTGSRSASGGAPAPVAASAGLVMGPGGTSLAGTNGGRGPRMTAKKRTMQWLADILSLQMDRPVLDMTGLTAKYDFSLDFTPERQITSADADTGISIFTAVQDQLGLKLETRKAPVEVMVIESAEKRPVGN